MSPPLPAIRPALDDKEVRTLAKDFKSDLKSIWCPGCGHFGVLNSLYRSLAMLGAENHETVVFSGIGCSGRLPGYVNTYGFNTIHGRSIPISTGLKLHRPELTVIAVGGDGDTLSIGAGHLPHACRRNVDITYILMDNSIYGLTKGQYSPTSPLETVTKTTLYGSIDTPIDPVEMTLAYNASFIARGFSGDPAGLAEVIAQAIEHDGFSFVHVIPPCVTFVGREEIGRVRQITRSLEEAGHDPTDRTQAEIVAKENVAEIVSCGVIWREDRPAYDDRLGGIQSKAKEMHAQVVVDKLLDNFRP